MTVRSNPIFTNNQEILKPKGDIVVEMSGKNDFKVIRELIEMMEAESKVVVNWSCDVMN
jgi:hypothetical protein